MREAKSKELKKDIEILSQTFERVVDRKESVIKSLAKDLAEAEEQYAMALRSHLQNVDDLIGYVEFCFIEMNNHHRRIDYFPLCLWLMISLIEFGNLKYVSFELNPCIITIQDKRRF